MTERLAEDAIGDLVLANRMLANENVLDGFGHVSIRHPARSDRYFMSRSRSPQWVTSSDIIEFTLDDEPLSHDGRALYAERAIHGSLYRARPDVHAICHNHAHSLIPFGATQVELRPLVHMAAVIGTIVPVWDIRDEFGDTDLLVTDHARGDALARTLGPHRVALMRGHGAVVVASTVRELVFTAIYLELNARLVLDARRLGEPRYLSEGEIERASQTLLRPLSQERAWEYWSRRADRSGG